MDQISSYATLQSAAAGMIHRGSDATITANLPLFIQLCEAELFDELLLKDAETESTLTLTTDVNYVALPATYVSPIALWLIVSTQRVKLESVLPQELPYDTSSSQPRLWAIDGVNIRFDCPAQEGYTAKFRHIATSRLSVSNTSNYLLLKRPDVYLYGTLKQVALFTKDMADLQKYSQLYESAKASLKRAESRNRSHVPLRTDIGVRGRTNILIGD
jgi:hypothetical protein